MWLPLDMTGGLGWEGAGAHHWSLQHKGGGRNASLDAVHMELTVSLICVPVPVV